MLLILPHPVLLGLSFPTCKAGLVHEEPQAQSQHTPTPCKLQGRATPPEQPLTHRGGVETKGLARGGVSCQTPMCLGIERWERSRVTVLG